MTTIDEAQELRMTAEQDAHDDIYYPQGGPQSEAYHSAVDALHEAAEAARKQQER